ncbi:MAG: hypothetical protein V1793_08100, partial [Pseudomonadota bacterium]
PFVHSALESATHLKGVFTIPKNKILIDELKTYIEDKQTITIVGSGFILPSPLKIRSWLNCMSHAQFSCQLNF